VADLFRVAEHHLDLALRDEHGRSAELILRDGVLRQSVLALRSGSQLAEHNSPRAATLQVLRGRVRVTGQGAEEEVAEGHVVVLTHERHSVTALTDAAFLLTTVTSVDQADGPERAR